MPTNVPPQYFEAEKRFRSAVTPQEKIAILREMLAIMPHHKGTDKLQADLRTKIAKLSKESQKKRGTHRFTYHIDKEGAGQVLLLGLPNSGKSSLLSLLTNSDPDIASYPFTTAIPVIGMLKYENIQIQIVELPALTHEFTKKWLSSLAESADIVAFVMDLGDLNEFGIIKEQMDRFAHKKTLVIANKTDLPEAKRNLERLGQEIETGTPIMGVSCEQIEGLEELQTRIYELLDIIRIYTKEPSKDPEMTNPIVLPRGSTVLNAARDIHKDFANNLRYARIWGADKFKGQRAARNQELTDGDVIEFHI